MEALYKRKGKFGLTGRDKRRESSKLHSQAKRDDIIATRRKIPLGDLSVASEYLVNPQS